MQAPTDEQGWRRLVPELLLAGVVLIWSSTFVITKDAMSTFTPFAFIAARFSIVLAVALAVLAIQGQRRGWARMWQVDRADLPRFLLASILGYTLYQIGFTVGLDNTSPFSSSLLIAMVPLYTLVMATLVGERHPMGAWLGVLVAVVGVAVFLLQRGGGGSLTGNLLSTAASVSFAGYGLINRALVRRYPPETVSAYTTLIGTIPLAVITYPDARAMDWGSLSTGQWLMILYMALFPIYLVYIAYNWVIARRGIAVTSAGLAVPVVSGILSAIVFEEAFGPLKVAGALLVLAGLVLIQRSRVRAAKAAVAAARTAAGPAA